MTAALPSRRIRVAILAPEQALGWTIMGPADMFSSAGTIWSSLHGEAAEPSAFDVAVVGRTDRPVHCFHGLRIIPSLQLKDLGYVPDVVLVPALFKESIRFGQGGWATPWRPFIEWIDTQHQRGALIASISLGTALLAETGLLDGHKATTHWAVLKSMAKLYRKIDFVHGESVIPAADGSRLITTAEGTAWQALVLLLVARYTDVETAIELARLFSIGQTAASWHKPGRSSFMPSLDHGDARILRAQRVMINNPTGRDALAGAITRTGLNRRTFERRFRLATGYSPLAYLQELRMQRARHLLSATCRSVDEIAMQVGYNDPAYFRDLFVRTSHVTPSKYRQDFDMTGLFKRARAA